MPEKQRWECHGHMMMNGTRYADAARAHRERPDAALVRRNLAALRAAGVTYFRDGGDPFGVWRVARALAPEYGIEYATPCFAVHRDGRYGGIVGRGYGSLREYRALLAELKTLGADFVKLMLSGIMTFQRFGALSCDPLPPEEMRELVRAAHGEGFSVMVHVNGADAVRGALAAGADSVEHGNFMDADCLALLAETGAVWVPTVAAAQAMTGRGDMDQRAVRETVERQLAAVRAGAAAGAKIAVGSDAGAVGVPFGAGARTERTLLLPCCPADALDAGCRESVRRFRRE
jgi:predicted amidohydrolase YtcJ